MIACGWAENYYGDSCSLPAYSKVWKALLAQPVERIHGKDEVTSSSLVEGSYCLLLAGRKELFSYRLVVQWSE